MNLKAFALINDLDARYERKCRLSCYAKQLYTPEISDLKVTTCNFASVKRIF